ncbi:Hypothetical predicted protein [Cloeon dipterum]|uniref:Uncharacterized protein n=1 Tax=Cloeon dipterum TaxID=197152 RepID=A0A8S1D6R1_9INSE|nr:Hypothetical predicted protein [Cloeon dipterum]
MEVEKGLFSNPPACITRRTLRRKCRKVRCPFNSSSINKWIQPKIHLLSSSSVCHRPLMTTRKKVPSDWKNNIVVQHVKDKVIAIVARHRRHCLCLHS